jgi:hypothetical protein
LNYFDGSEITLGDVVSVPTPDGSARARVVMLGDSYAHLEIDANFLEWVRSDRVLKAGSVVVEWLDKNPFAHSDRAYAPVGDYMFTAVDESVRRVV